ncbi:cytochrome c oxidase assembly factor 1 family protein [Phyllobacterium calauticae]|jgi:hypothetical protein|uniref:cytochrome c oxidase assembly factor 1 family protein n=1 Tax=Phyllobacterium calauticae TaxID=2817027 RepID=UPI001CBEFF2D|nr:cytochrome c oxidase assembly factor 1 family protein [Phyllobacterium calauticae]MBZ3692591.1 hypothetical protein [Phyllobacterium calauticae]
MSACNDHYLEHRASLSERLFAAVSRTAGTVASIAEASRNTIVRQRRLRATEAALDSLPENIRFDIGWPDLYERQVGGSSDLNHTRQ